MFERFSRAAKAAVKAAQGVAAQDRAAEVRPEHLMRGVLAEDALVSALLDHLGTNAASVQEALDRRARRFPDGLDADDASALQSIGIDLTEITAKLGPDLAPPRRGSNPPYSRGAKKALELALREAINLGDRSIGGEHLLLGLARGGDRTVADALADCGLDLPTIRSAVVERHRAAG